MSDSSSHGRTSILHVISGPALCFLLEYTVFPVCCHHLPLRSQETQGSQDVSPGRPQVVRLPKRHFLVVASRGGGPSQRGAEGGCGPPRLHAVHIQDLLGGGEAGTKRELFPLLQIGQHHHQFCGQRNRLVSAPPGQAAPSAAAHIPVTPPHHTPPLQLGFARLLRQLLSRTKW